jgi:hypothetical protein
MHVTFLISSGSTTSLYSEWEQRHYEAYGPESTLRVFNRVPNRSTTLPSNGTIFTGGTVSAVFTASNPTTLTNYQTGLEVAELREDQNGNIYQGWTIKERVQPAPGARSFTLSAVADGTPGRIFYRFRAWNQWSTSEAEEQIIYGVTVRESGSGQPVPPSEISELNSDSNNNGVPDLVEKAMGLNPSGTGNQFPANFEKIYYYDANGQLIQSPERAYDIDPEGNIKGE